MKESYQVQRHKLGVVVIGPIPLDELTPLLKAWKEQGLDWCDAVVAQHFYASMCVTRKSDSDKWRAELGLAEKGKEAKGVKMSFGT